MVTGMLLGWIVASIYGIKKTTEHLDEKQKQEQKEELSAPKGKIRKILTMLIFGCKEPVVEKKKGFFSRLFKK